MIAGLARYDAMCRAIDAAYKVDEVKDIRDKALALEQYARQAQNIQNERRACEVRLRAERKAGKLSAALQRHQGNSPHRAENTKTKELRRAGVSLKQAERWEKLAAVPAETFEQHLADQTQRATTNGIIRAAKTPKITPVSKDALWLWGRLRDFDRDGLLAKNPAEVLETMTPEMLDDTHVLSPRVAAWLKRIGVH